MSPKRTCHVSGDDCTAPAGWGTPSGVMEGEKSTKGTCHHCGLPVCKKCSRDVRARGRRVRVCDNCEEDRARRRTPRSEAGA